jgi:hypothetical protein
MDIFCFGDSHARYLKKSNMLGWAGVSDMHLCDSFEVRRVHAERLFAAFEGVV